MTRRCVLLTRSTSVHPVNRFLAFHTLSPWRNNTNVNAAFLPLSAAGAAAAGAAAVVSAADAMLL